MLLGAAAHAAVTAGATYFTRTGLVATTVDLAMGVEVGSTRELLGAEFVSDDITHAPFDVGPDGTVVFVFRRRVIPRPSFHADLYALACIMHLLRSSVARSALIRLSSLSRLSLTASVVLQRRARWRSRGPDGSFYSYLRPTERCMDIITWIVVGLVAGLLASAVVGGIGYGLIGDIVIGIVGAVFGGWLFATLGVSLPFRGIASTIFVAFVGAVVLLLLIRALRPGPRRRA